MNLADTMPPPDREALIRIARVQLFEARRTIHRDWKITLLEWAADRRRRAAALPRRPAQQSLDL